MKLRKLAVIASVLALSSPVLVQAGKTDTDLKAGASATTPAGKVGAGADATANRKGAAAGTNAKADSKRGAVGATGSAAAGATAGKDKSKDSVK